MHLKKNFEIHYTSGVLPETFPKPRAKVTRAEKSAAKAQKKPEQEEAADTPAPEETTLAIIPEKPPMLEDAKPEETTAESETTEDTAEQAAETSELAEEAKANKEARIMEISYNVTGPRRKELATAVGDFIGTAPIYQKAPTYAFAIGSYIIDRNGTLSGEKNEGLTEALAVQGFTVA